MARHPFCAECGAYHDLRTPGCATCRARALYLEWKLTRPGWYRALLDRKNTERRLRRAEGRCDSLGRAVRG